MKVRIDSQRCRGHARCLTIAPDAFDFLDEADKAIVIPEGLCRTDPVLLIKAEEECPERAILIESNGGREG
jgi:ferredoxin